MTLDISEELIISFKDIQSFRQVIECFMSEKYTYDWSELTPSVNPQLLSRPDASARGEVVLAHQGRRRQPVAAGNARYRLARPDPMQHRALKFRLETQVRRAAPTQVIPDVAGEQKMVGVDGIGRERINTERAEGISLVARLEVQMRSVAPACVAPQP